MSDLEQMQKQLEIFKESRASILPKSLMDIILTENTIWALEKRIEEQTPKTYLANLSENKRNISK